MQMTDALCAPIPIVSGIAALCEERRVWLCDVWGVLHDGVNAFPAAIEACRQFRARGGEIVLVSNSPRPSRDVIAHLSSLGIGAGTYDAIVTSGDVTRRLVGAHSGKPVFHLGPGRDNSLFDGLNVRFAPAAEAEVLVCTGFFEEDREVPEDYDDLLNGFAARDVPMICANPDLMVEHGNRLLPCAGLLAQRYAALGQTVVQAGKPYAPIYEAAIARLSTSASRDAMLAIGDGLDTDIKGARAQGIDSVYVVSLVHFGEAAGATLSPHILNQAFANRPYRPIAAMPQLYW